MEARQPAEQAVEEGEPRAESRLPAVPFSVSGGCLLLALGVGALLYGRFGGWSPDLRKPAAGRCWAAGAAS